MNYINTAELQWLEHRRDHENMFNTGVVRENMFDTGVVQAIECQSKWQVRRHKRDIFSIFYKIKVCCVFSLESPHRGDSNRLIEAILMSTHNIPFSI